MVGSCATSPARRRSTAIEPGHNRRPEVHTGIDVGREAPREASGGLVVRQARRDREYRSLGGLISRGSRVQG
jgi:hypothetical protein